MKLLLIYPPNLNAVTDGLPKILEEGLGFTPPIGLLYIAAAVKQRTQWDVEFMDCAAERLNYEKIRERIGVSNPDAVGITVTNIQLLDCVEVAKIAKQVCPSAKVIFGGPHVHLYPEETIAFDFVDFVFIGEAEWAVTDLLNLWGKTGGYGAVPGLYYKGSGGIMRGAPVELHDDLDRLPFPARSLSKLNLYVSPLTHKKMVTAMITSRGCTFQCTYCARVHLGKRFRARSADNVVDEMQECRRLGIDHIRIYDDTFTLDRQRVLDICRAIQSRNIRVSWDIRAHVNTLDKEMLEALKQSGCQLICFGIESGNDEILKKIKKGIVKEKAAEIFRLTKKTGIKTLAYFMLGFPGESREQMLETIDFAKRLDPDFCHFAILMPFPGSAIYEEGLSKKIFPHDVWRRFAAEPRPEFKSPLWVEHVSRREMWDLLEKAYREFYFRPGYLVNRLKELRSLGDLGRKLQTAFHLFQKNHVR